MTNYCNCDPEDREPDGQGETVRCDNCRGVIWE
jgi:hypothetical protein